MTDPRSELPPGSSGAVLRLDDLAGGWFLLTTVGTGRLSRPLLEHEVSETVTELAVESRKSDDALSIKQDFHIIGFPAQKLYLSSCHLQRSRIPNTFPWNEYKEELHPLYIVRNGTLKLGIGETNSKRARIQVQCHKQTTVAKRALSDIPSEWFDTVNGNVKNNNIMSCYTKMKC